MKLYSRYVNVRSIGRPGCSSCVYRFGAPVTIGVPVIFRFLVILLPLIDLMLLNLFAEVCRGCCGRILGLDQSVVLLLLKAVCCRVVSSTVRCTGIIVSVFQILLIILIGKLNTWVGICSWVNDVPLYDSGITCGVVISAAYLSSWCWKRSQWPCPMENWAECIPYLSSGISRFLLALYKGFCTYLTLISPKVYIIGCER